jgi:putative DNA primase/helicase
MSTAIKTTTVLPVQAQHIPDDLTALPRWVIWKLEERDGKLTKIPYRAADHHLPASSTDPTTWGSFSAALATMEDGKSDGVGFVLGDGFTGVDLDDCRDPQTGVIADWAQTITTTLNSYTEISPTGTGLKIFTAGTLPPGGRRKGLIEMYPGDRYFTVTGWHLRGTPTTVEPRQAQLAGLHAEIFGTNGTKTIVHRPAGPVDVDDVQLLDRARRAKNGDRFDALFAGDWSDFQSRSEADLALASRLAFWTGNDHARIDRLFRLSGLMREKWDSRRGSQTYGDITIEKAIATTTETWIPRVGRPRDHERGEHLHSDEGRVPSSFARTDLGNAEYFAHRYGDTLRYDHRRGRWLIWNGQHWIPDNDGAVHRFAKDTVRARLAAVATIDDDQIREAEARWALKAEHRDRLHAVLTLAKNEKPISISGDGWDADPYLLGVPNGVLDLQTGLLRSGRPEDLISMRTTVPYDPAATCPLWEATLAQIFESTAMVNYIQRAIGYSMTGDCREETFWLGVGPAGGGKGTVTNTVAWVLGDYADDLPFATFELTQRNAIPNDIAKLVGKRFVTSSETDAGRHLNVARIKALTGRDPVTARFMRENYFTFTPTAKFWLSSNKTPIVNDASGIWRRLHFVPFTRSFVGREDKGLKDRLRDEGPGILRWLVQGCLAWQRDGLTPPEDVLTATRDYKDRSDVLADFLAAACEIDPIATTAAKDLYAKYRDWAGEQGLSDRERLSSKAFGLELGDRPDVERGRDHRGRFYRGIRIRQSQPSEESNT